ncbi:sensor histidine kinase [Pokkaliibacter plantistimulans]|uniref:sensor histidine kinase n=1 Tax=Pokkaliibacter plantistimulans TaxID=1635171 RepID=UPI0014033C1A|nr:HAMP domain-containing sensor histidine kinase [Pokkaliibacter plantistimulans]
MTQIDSKTEQLRDSVDKLVNQRLDELNHFNEDTRTHLLLSSTLLLALSLVLMIMSGLVITRPVRRLEKMITLLGEGKALPSNRIGGPAELANLGGKLHWLDQQLASLEQQKKQFLRHMSHELKTPLASLREGADLLGEGVLGELNTSQQEVVELMQYNSQQLQRLIEQLLDYNMLHQNLPMAVSACELPTLIKEVVTLHQLSVQQKQIHLQTQGDALSWPVDRHKLQRCLDNLISNAINYGAREGQILVAWQTLNNRLIIDVANTGQTIAAAERVRIFEPFYQGQSQRLGPLKGSGIGLSVARDCIEAHGGSLTLHDLHGFDVCFRIELPESEHLAV